jgi:hypothetical protein
MELRYQALAGRSVLAGISLGRQVLVRALEAIQKEPDLPAPLLVSFDAIDAATASFLREAVVGLGKTLRARGSRYYPVVINAPEAVVEELRLLTERGAVLLTAEADRRGRLKNARVMGSLEPMLRLVLETAARKGETDARELREAHGEGQGSTVWNNRLASLSEQGLLMEVSQGRSKRYRPVVEGEVAYG